MHVIFSLGFFQKDFVFQRFVFKSELINTPCSKQLDIFSICFDSEQTSRKISKYFYKKNNRGIFLTQSIYNLHLRQNFLRKYLTAFSRYLFSQKSSIVDLRLGKYTSEQYVAQMTNYSKEVNLTLTLQYHLEILLQQHLSLFHHVNLKE